MKICPNCQFKADDDSVFCEKCGTRMEEYVEAVEEKSDEKKAEEKPESDQQEAEVKMQEAEVKAQDAEAETKDADASPVGDNEPEEPEKMFCPECGAEITDTDSAFCESCGAALKKAAEENKKKEFKLPKWLLIVGAVVIVVAIAAVVIALFANKGSSKTPPYVVYLKDSELSFNALKGKESIEITDGFLDDLSEDPYYYPPVYLSKDGKTLFYPDNFDDNNCFKLYSRDVGKSKSESKKIDSDVSWYRVCDDEQHMFLMKDDRDLYYYDIKHDDKEKVCSECYGRTFSEDGSIIWFFDDEDNLYRYEGGKEKEKMDKDVASIQHVTEDGKTAYYLKTDNTL